MHVVGMYSPENEYVPFTKTIDVNDGERKGNVEVWLLDIENIMRETLKDISKKAVSFIHLSSIVISINILFLSIFINLYISSNIICSNHILVVYRIFY
jgi:hypothetical protein